MPDLLLIFNYIFKRQTLDVRDHSHWPNLTLKEKTKTKPRNQNKQNQQPNRKKPKTKQNKAPPNPQLIF